jgi:hypothetical protein
MNHNFLGRALLIAFLSVALATPSRANNIQDTAAKDVALVAIGIVVVAVGIAVLVTVLVLRHKKTNSAITGCVLSGANGMNLTDEKDKRIYTLSGDPVGVKLGDRMTLEGKRRKDSGKTPVFEAYSVSRDYGVCHP